MSRKHDVVKGYYVKGLWNKTMCRNAVIKGWITPEEFTEITGERYENDTRD